MFARDLPSVKRKQDDRRSCGEGFLMHTKHCLLGLLASLSLSLAASAAEIRAEPGLVDSAPTSMMSAPGPP